MPKRKISAKEAVAAIRSGMDDAALMKEYGLAPSGLQSLFDKLVTGGYLDLAEIQDRMPGFMGTVNIEDPFFPAREDGTQSTSHRTGAWINAQEAARDVRGGLDDAALMAKYRLTSRGLRSMVDKLITVGLITQADLDRRKLGLQENTVALSEEMLGLTDVFKYLGQPVPKREARPKPKKPDPTMVDSGKVAIPDTNAERPQQMKERRPVVESHWYDNTIVVVLTLVGLFPVGFYGLYLNSSLSRKDKGLLTFVWISLVIASAVLVSEWFLFPGF